MHAQVAAHFAKLWSAVAIELPLWECGGRRNREDGASITRCGSPRFHRPPKAVALPPHSKVLRTKRAPHSSRSQVTNRNTLGLTLFYSSQPDGSEARTV